MSDSCTRVRRFPRIASEHAVLVKKLSDAANEGFAKTRVVGLGGCMFTSAESIGVGAEVEILISVVCRVIRAVGRVVYEIPTPPGDLEIGIEFLDLGDSDCEVIRCLFDPLNGECPPAA